MPIHTSWKSMATGMKTTYKKGKVKCRKFADGSQVCMSEKAWSVFFATISKMGASDTKPRPKKKINESKLIDWFMEAKMENDIPRWVNMALKVLKSDKYSAKIKTYWKKRLTGYCKKNPKLKICRQIKINESLEAMSLNKELLACIAEEIVKGE